MNLPDSVMTGFNRGMRFRILFAATSLITAAAFAQQPTRTEQFVPVDQLDAVFEQSSGVLLPRDEYQELVRQAEAARHAAANTPAPILVRAATYNVKHSGNHALVNVTLDLEQFADRWQHVSIPVDNLQLEKATIGDTPAVVGRQSANVLQLFHRTTERFTVELSFSTALGRVGSDRAAGFEIIRNTPVHLNVECPAGHHLLLDGRRLKRPQLMDQPATYALPVGIRDRTELQWTSRRHDSAADTLVFARSDVQVRLSPDTMRWMTRSRIAVFGGQISRLTASVPATLEITAIESRGLESWELNDDPDQPGNTNLTVTWRQPVDADRLVEIRGVAPLTDGAPGNVPTVVYNEMAAHTGRLLITHEDQLRLMATSGDGIRQLVPDGPQVASSSNSMFDFWLQNYRLSVAVRPRDRELFSQITSQLSITDSKASFTADVSVETLNAPLFEIQLDTPKRWQLLSVTDAAGQAVRWRASEDSSSITVEPDEPVPSGELLKLKLSLDRHIDDPQTIQQIELPVIRTPQASTVAGRYTISSASDLQVAPTEIHGLVPTGEDSGNIVFEAQGTPVSGTLSVVRKPVRLSSRSEIRCWMDARQTTTTAMVTIDVINGTTRTLQIRLPETTGDDLRFDVVGIGQVPGYEAAGMSHLVPPRIKIAEAKADEPVDGFRLWHLTFDRRFAGSVTLTTRIQQTRDGDQLSAPTVEVPGAIHQEGLIAFEASPDQQFDEADDQAVQSLRPADPSLVTAPAESSGRRIARVFQFVRSAYEATLSETRYDTQVVPTAVCRTIQNISLLSDDGSTQRSCVIHLHCIGVQTLRFTLPESENAFLWSTVLNDDAVEVRRDEGDYLVAIPTGDDRTDHVLELLFESHGAASSAFTATEHESVRFSVDVGAGKSSLIDVLEQTWQVQYPSDTLLLDHSGGFHALGTLTQPGWLQNLSSGLSMPSLAQLGVRGLVAGLILGMVFLITALIVRRHWVVMGVAVIVGGIIAVPLLLYSVNERAASPNFTELGKDLAGGSPLTYELASPSYLEDRLAMPAPRRAAGKWADETELQTNGDEGVALSADEKNSGPVTRVEQSQTHQLFDGMLGSPVVPESVIQATNGIDGITLGRGQQTLTEEDSEFSGQVVGLAAAPPRRGAARLSVRVNLEQPGDYQTTDFRSVGAGATSGRLSLVMRTASQVRMIRFLAAALVLFACWMLRRQSLAVKLGSIATAGLVALALVPLAPNQWQAVLDGIVLGTLLAVVLWPGAAMINWIQNCNCCRRAATVAGFLLLAMATSSASADESGAEQLVPPVGQPSRDVVLPYTPGEPPLTADRVFVPHQEFLRLYKQAHPGEVESEPHPADAIVTAGFYQSGERRQVQDAKWTQSFNGRIVIRSFSDTPVQVTLPFSNVAVRTVKLDESDAIVIRDGSALQVHIPSAGLHVLDVVFDVSASIDASGGTVGLSLSAVPSGLLTFELPEENLNVRVNGRSDTFRTEGATISIPLTSEKQIQIEWLPAATRSSSDTIVHSTINSVLEINDQGLTLVAVGEFNCRQGSIAEAELNLPTGYGIRSVEGNEIAGWSVEGSADAPRLKIVLRSGVTEKTSLRLTLFSRQVITPERQSFPVPIVELIGASRSTGTVCVVAGAELDVRTESLSGVSQINPSDAVLTGHDENPVAPILAWRFNRHPADVVIRAARVADRLTANLLHGVQLEPERQLWTSSFDVTIQGAPRRRLDLRIPKTFLAFEVDCTDLADWYITETEDNDDGQEFKTLSVQLQTARTGRVQVVIQGQNQRSTDRTTAGFVTPQLTDADEVRTQLSIWLGPATEISGFQGVDWSTIATTQIAKQLQTLRPGPPGISFTTQNTQPAPIALKLRSATASVLCESVTVTNVTNTSIERTLALSWQISRSAADTFSVELPIGVAETLDFRISGLRQEERTPLDNDQVRITFHLQYPVGDRFFAAGTGAIPLPESSEFRSIPVTFVTGDNERSPMSIANQSHFWVIVNQSDGVLEAVQPDIDTDNIATDQLQTSIPEGFLKQSVAIRRITLQQPGSIWRVRFPELQQTTPAVIAIAQHVTVIADDGTWRSRHTLQIRNESRQFLPVQLPINSRPLFCLVKNKPTRIVTRSSDDGVLHLIPIPQSGEVSAPFEVQFAVAGSLAGGAESIRSRWQQNSVEVPVPTFPEYRDNHELGVTVSRNTWSVYVPESWSSSADDDPRLTNVLHADTALLEDAIVLSSIDNSKSLLKQAGSVNSSSTKFGLFNELSSQLEILKTQRANGREAQRDLTETQKTIERYLGDNRVEQAAASTFRAITDGTNNTNLTEQALTRNNYLDLNNSALIEGNGISGVTINNNAGTGNGGDGISIRGFGNSISGNGRLGFSLEIQDEEQSAGGGKPGKSEPADTLQRRQRGMNNKRSQLLRKDFDAFEKPGNGPVNSQRLRDSQSSPGEESDAMPRTDAVDSLNLLGEIQSGRAGQDLPQTPGYSSPGHFGEDFDIQFQQGSFELGIPSEAIVQTAAPPVSTGLLSLRFDIPTDGERLDFVRTGGNAALALNVRSAESHSWLQGILWAIGCIAGLLLVLRTLRAGNADKLVARFAMIFAVVGIVGWFLLPNSLSMIALLAAIAGSVVFCGTRIRRSFPASVEAA